MNIVIYLWQGKDNFVGFFVCDKNWRWERQICIKYDGKGAGIKPDGKCGFHGIKPDRKGGLTSNLMENGVRCERSGVERRVSFTTLGIFFFAILTGETMNSFNLRN